MDQIVFVLKFFFNCKNKQTEVGKGHQISGEPVSIPKAGFEPGSEQDCCLRRLQSYCSNRLATMTGFYTITLLFIKNNEL